MLVESTIIRLNNKSSDVWRLISNLDMPEIWLPVLDSRKLTNNPGQVHVYFPSDIASVCPDSISFGDATIDSVDKVVRFSLVTGVIQILLTVSVSEVRDGGILEVTAGSEISSSDVPEINDMLSKVCAEIASNINLICAISYPGSRSSESKSNNPGALAERYPELSVNAIQRVSADSCSDIEWAMKDVCPVIISNYGNTLPNFSSLGQFEWWCDSFGGQTLPFVEFKGLAYGARSVRGRTTMGMFLSMLKSNPNALRFAVYEYPTYNILGLHEYLTPPQVIPKSCPHLNANIWMGAAGVTSPMHQDGRGIDCTGSAPGKVHNVNFQVAGRKRVLLAHPNQTAYLYPKTASLKDDRFPESEIDFFASLNFDKFPNIRNAQLYEAELRPGELLYIPRGWWHAFYALENSINYNVFFSSHQY